MNSFKDVKGNPTINMTVHHGPKVVRGQLLNNRDLIEFGLKQLNMYLHDGRVPDQTLLDDIAAYEWLLANDPVLEQYVKLKQQQGYRHLRPRQIKQHYPDTPPKGEL